jgi:hypothetical protein
MEGQIVWKRLYAAATARFIVVLGETLGRERFAFV